MKKSGKIILAVSNALLLGITLFANALSAILPLNGRTPGQLSDLYPNLFVPAGLTFSIWGVIYLLLLAFVVYQFITLLKKESVVEKIGPWFIISCLANTGWIFAWHYELMTVSVLAMLLLLGSLIVIYLKVLRSGTASSVVEKIFTHIPFSVYLGWISVATIANLTAAFVKWGWNGWGMSPEVWLMVVLTTATALALIYIFKYRDIFYPMVTIWALYGIWIKQIVGLANPLLIVKAPLMGFIVVLSLAIILQIVRGNVYKKV